MSDVIKSISIKNANGEYIEKLFEVDASKVNYNASTLDTELININNQLNLLEEKIPNENVLVSLTTSLENKMDKNNIYVTNEPFSVGIQSTNTQPSENPELEQYSHIVANYDTISTAFHNALSKNDLLGPTDKIESQDPFKPVNPVVSTDFLKANFYTLDSNMSLVNTTTVTLIPNGSTETIPTAGTTYTIVQNNAINSESFDSNNEMLLAQALLYDQNAKVGDKINIQISQSGSGTASTFQVLKFIDKTNIKNQYDSNSRPSNSQQIYNAQALYDELENIKSLFNNYIKDLYSQIDKL